jgi:hypothetical protein
MFACCFDSRIASVAITLMSRLISKGFIVAVASVLMLRSSFKSKGMPSVLDLRLAEGGQAVLNLLSFGSFWNDPAHFFV